MIARDYQTKVFDTVFAFWDSGIRRVLARVPTGGGKTFIAGELIRKTPGPVLFMAHRRNLIEQASLHLDAVNLPHGIIAPGYPMRGSRIRVASVETLVRRLSQVEPAALIITDECFTGETLVESNNGPTRIDSLVIGDRVLSSDGRFHAVTKIIKKMKTKTIIVNGVECTPNHEFFTARGLWERAETLTRDSMVLTIIKYAKLQNGSSRTLYRMRDGRRHRRQKQSGVLPAIRSNLLFGRLQGLVRIAEALRDNGANEPEICLRENAKKKPYAPTGDKGEGLDEAPSNGPQAAGSGRQRPRPDDSTARAVRGARMGNRSGRSYYEKAKQWVADKLQDRHRKRGLENWNRGRREFSLLNRAPGSGQKERLTLAWVRVENSPIQEQRGRRESRRLHRSCPVFDLTVEGSHNYFAGGMLVHNCHHSVCGSYRKIYEWSPDALHLGLTATPKRLDGQGLGDLFDTIANGPTTAELIGRGFLSPYRAWAPPEPPEVDPEHMSEDELEALMDRPAITGDAIEHYSRLTPGMPALCFCSTILHAEHVAGAFRAAGWRSKALHSDLDPLLIDEYFRRLRAGELDILTNCGMVDEGTDVPGVAAVIDLAPTASLSRFLQRCGRMLRPVYAEGLPIDTDLQRREAIARGPKPWAALLDHSGNIERHGLPDDAREWSLDGAVATPGPTLKRCPACYEMVPIGSASCPECQWIFSAGETKSRGLPEVGDGKLEELGASRLLYDAIKKDGWSIVQARGIAYTLKFAPELGERIFFEVFGRMG